MTRVARAAWRLAAACLLIAALPGWVHAAVDVDVRVDRRSFIAGESVTLEVVVRGASGGLSEPSLGLPSGLELLGSARSQNFSWINGRSSSETVFRYEIGSDRAGRYTIGPVDVRVGNQTYRGAAVEVEVTSAPRQVGGATRGAASLTADVTPAQPYVGEPVLLKVRLVMRAALAESPEYAPPAATGFWAERASDPETYYAQQGGARVLVTETRTRLYPLAAGKTTIGPATAALVLDDEQNPFSIFGVGQKQVVVKSAPVDVPVRPLPAGAPDGFDGAVGRVQFSWTADRSETAIDVPLVVRLDVRGAGNLPLMHTPAFGGRLFEVFGGSLEDSLGEPGTAAGGRRRFQWTVLPSRMGRLEIPVPRFVWFDLDDQRYHVVDAPPIVVQVGPPIGSSADAGADEVFPGTLLRRPVDPGATPARPWALALAGGLLGAAIVIVRSARPDAARSAVRARCREWLRAIGLAEGPSFWDAAAEACVWLTEQGSPVGSLGKEIASSRYSGLSSEEPRVRRRLVELLSQELERRAPSPAAPVIAGVLALTAVGLVLVLGPHGGDGRDRQRARAADDQARRGDLDAAAMEWRRLWQTSPSPGLAARLAWAEVKSGDIGRAAAWILRGDESGARDPGLGFVAERVREGGGLTGGWQPRLPVRPLEWGIAAGLLAGFGVFLWPRKLPAAGLLAAALLVAFAPGIEREVRAAGHRTVVLEATPLVGADVDLEAGQVVSVISEQGPEAVVRVGPIEGRVPADKLAAHQIEP